jgi:hypothetical protein
MCYASYHTLKSAREGREEEEEALLCMYILGYVFLFDIPLLLLLFFFRPDEELKRIERRKKNVTLLKEREKETP